LDDRIGLYAMRMPPASRQGGLNVECILAWFLNFAISSAALPCFKARIGLADHVNTPAAAYHLAIAVAFFGVF